MKVQSKTKGNKSPIRFSFLKELQILKSKFSFRRSWKLVGYHELKPVGAWPMKNWSFNITELV